MSRTMWRAACSSWAKLGGGADADGAMAEMIKKVVLGRSDLVEVTCSLAPRLCSAPLSIL